MLDKWAMDIRFGEFMLGMVLKGLINLRVVSREIHFLASEEGKKALEEMKKKNVRPSDLN